MTLFNDPIQDVFRDTVHDVFKAPAVSEGWDLGNASYDGKSGDISAQDTTLTDVAFKPDGTKMYIFGNTNLKVFQYTLTTPWDVSTRVFDSKSFTVAEDTLPTHIAFKPDGLKMYITGDTNNRIFQYTLATAWDVSTAVYDTKSLDVSTEGTKPKGIAFKPDGSKIYVTDSTAGKVFQYGMTTEWDISTGSTDSKSATVSGQDAGPFDVDFKPDGTRMFILGTVNEAIFQYTLTTPWDASTAVYASKTFGVTSEDGSPQGFAFKPDGLKMYMAGNDTDTVFQYSL